MGKQLPGAETFLTVKWVVPIIRILLAGPNRFSRIRAALPGLAANILADRLRILENMGVLERVILPEPASFQVYRLTAFGHQARCIVDGMECWSAGRQQVQANVCEDGKMSA